VSGILNSNEKLKSESSNLYNTLCSFECENESVWKNRYS